MTKIDACIDYIESFGHKENMMLAREAAAELAQLRAELDKINFSHELLVKDLAYQEETVLPKLRAENERLKEANLYYRQDGINARKGWADCLNENHYLRAELDKAQTENVAWEITANLYKAQLDEANKAVDEAREHE